MIFEALSCVTEDVNEHLRNKLRISENKVILSGIANQDGSLAMKDENKLIATLVNIENDTTGQSNRVGSASKTLAHVAPDININLYVLFSAYFSSNNYPESLRFLSFLIAYFHNKSVFNRSNTPGLDDRIEKLIFKMENLKVEGLSNMWTMLGAKYMPSVMYKMRMLTFDDSIVKEYRPEVAGVSYNNKV